MKIIKVDKLENELEKEFHISRYIIAYKFLLGLIETILGLSIVFFGKRLFEIYQSFKTKELLEDPHDLIVNATEKLLPYFFKHRDYIILFLLVIGVVKIIGAVGLFYRKHWGLDLLVAITLVLLPFEAVSLILHFSFAKLIYFVINIFIALYLVNFRPKDYFVRLKKRVKGRKK